MNRFYRITISIGLFLHFIPTILWANHELIVEESVNSSATQDLFSTNELLKVTVLSDFKSILKDRGDDRSYHKALLYYLNEEKDTIYRKIKLKTRGNFRRDPANCKNPPLMMKFGKLQTADSIFTDQTKLKLVTHCQLEKYVLLEYLAYRIYNLITENSYRVRLAHITYADLKTRKPYSTRFAFFIENQNELQKRIGMEKHKAHVVQYFLQREDVISMAVFQYLIGNDDWYATSAHNLTILKNIETDSLFAAPYDFDWSNFVDAKYTKPSGVPGYLLAERRVYKGLCMSRDDLLLQQEKFNANKEHIVELIRSADYLPNSRKKEAINYVEKFYKTLNDDASLETIFQQEECITKPNFK